MSNDGLGRAPVSQFFGIAISMYQTAPQHRVELRANWERARQGLPVERVVPLE